MSEEQNDSVKKYREVPVDVVLRVRAYQRLPNRLDALSRRTWLGLVTQLDAVYARYMDRIKHFKSLATTESETT